MIMAFSMSSKRSKASCKVAMVDMRSRAPSCGCFTGCFIFLPARGLSPAFLSLPRPRRPKALSPRASQRSLGRWKNDEGEVADTTTAGGVHTSPSFSTRGACGKDLEGGVLGADLLLPPLLLLGDGPSMLPWRGEVPSMLPRRGEGATSAAATAVGDWHSKWQRESEVTVPHGLQGELPEDAEAW